MINVALFVYALGALVTWIYAGYLTGRQFHKVLKANPTQAVQINWMSVFFQGLTWVGFWASVIGERLERRTITQPPIEAVNDKMRKL